MNGGDKLAQLDTTGLEHDLERATQAFRQAQIEVQVAEAERQEAAAQLESVTEGEGALEVEETQAALRVAEAKVERLRAEHESLKPLLEKGFITAEELDRISFELEQAEAQARLVRRKTELFVQRTYPREKQRARLLLAQREARFQHSRAKGQEAEQLVSSLRVAIKACSIHASRSGLVVYEDYLASSPRRKIRIGDRVTASQGLVTIPEVNRMLVESSVRESEVHRLRRGLPALITVDAFPGLRLSGRLLSVGALARISVERPFEEKRFDLVVEVDPIDVDVRPEMTARVEILVRERKDVLLIPLNAVFEHEGGLVVHVVRPWGVQTRTIEVGASDDRYAEVVVGLTEGEHVSLIDLFAGEPAQSASEGREQTTPGRTP